MFRKLFVGSKVVFVVASMCLWFYVGGTFLLDFPPWDALKKNVSVVDSLELPDHGRVAILQEWKSLEGYSTYFLYQTKDGINHLYFVNYDEPKFHIESCEIKKTGTEVQVTDRRGYYVRCRFDLEKLEFRRGSTPAPDMAYAKLNEINDMSDILSRRVPDVGDRLLNR